MNATKRHTRVVIIGDYDETILQEAINQVIDELETKYKKGKVKDIKYSTAPSAITPHHSAMVIFTYDDDDGMKSE